MSIDEASLARLMTASQRGDRGAYRALLAACRTWLTRYFARRIAPHHIDDLVQETLVSMHRKLATWLALLPPKQAQAIMLVKIEGASIAEASRICGQSESLVKVNIHRGLKKLAEMVESE